MEDRYDLDDSLLFVSALPAPAEIVESQNLTGSADD